MAAGLGLRPRRPRRVRGDSPSYVQGAYDRDNRFYLDWDAITRDEDSIQAWLRDWVYDLDGRAAYVETVPATSRVRMTGTTGSTSTGTRSPGTRTPSRHGCGTGSTTSTAAPRTWRQSQLRPGCV